MNSVKSTPSSCGWSFLTLEDVCANGGQYGLSVALHRTPHGLPVLRMGNINEGLITWDDLKFAEVAPDNVSAYRLENGDILFNRTNSAELVGKSAVFRGERDALFASYLIRFKIIDSIADADFVCAYINSEFGRRFVQQRMARAAGQVNISASTMRTMRIPMPPLVAQQRIASQLREQSELVENARRAVKAQLVAVRALPAALAAEDALHPETVERSLGEVLNEVTAGIGEAWRGQPVLGATRAGLAPAKEGVGKQPHRYKPVAVGSVFYNPMRILLGSIALVDEGDSPGITSPDYVVIRAREGVLHPVWFYYWFRSPAGAEFIKTLTRGAVRERLLFNRLAPGRIPVPPWNRQLVTVERVRAAEKARSSLAARLKVMEKLPAALLREVFGSETGPIGCEAVSS